MKEHRTKMVGMRVTAAEEREIKAAARNTNLSSSDYMRRKVLGQPIRVAKVPEVNTVTCVELTRNRQELRAIGNNINQIARVYNSYAQEHRQLPNGNNLLARLAELESVLQLQCREINALKLLLLGVDSQESSDGDREYN
jgi:hypothetical protein